MEKISELSKKLDDILKLIFKLLLIFGGIGIAFLAAFALIPALTEQITGNCTLTLGNVELSLSEDFNDNIVFVRSMIGFLVTMMAVNVASLCYGIAILRKIIIPMSEQKPFDGTVSVNMGKLGKFIMIASVAINLANELSSTVLYNACGLSELLLSDKIVAVNTNFSVVDGKMLFLGVLVILLSYVFKYGEELQKQADETL